MRNLCVQDWNADGSQGYELAMNHMGDVAPEEHRAMLAGNRQARVAWAADPRQVRPSTGSYAHLQQTHPLHPSRTEGKMLQYTRDTLRHVCA